VAQGVGCRRRGVPAGRQLSAHPLCSASTVPGLPSFRGSLHPLPRSPASSHQAAAKGTRRFVHLLRSPHPSAHTDPATRERLAEDAPRNERTLSPTAPSPLRPGRTPFGTPAAPRLAGPRRSTNAARGLRPSARPSSGALQGWLRVAPSSALPNQRLQRTGHRALQPGFGEVGYPAVDGDLAAPAAEPPDR
jgi:hypothetical protein